MKEMNTGTKPRLFRSGKPVPVDILIADPSITVVEAGSTLGFLLAEFRSHIEGLPGFSFDGEILVAPPDMM
jgi:hypothetical protein